VNASSPELYLIRSNLPGSRSAYLAVVIVTSLGFISLIPITCACAPDGGTTRVASADKLSDDDLSSGEAGARGQARHRWQRGFDQRATH
jgi:hypothetical protein